jgi:DNA-binding NarL/FixJ family response regulator
MKFSVLVVDDHAGWRERLCMELQKSARWRIVGEAGDGLQAVRQAQALEPDLILLDIGLPVLNGLDAARRIIAANPRSRILFLSEHRSWNVVEAACATGARGYVCKTDGACRLVVAMDAVMEGVGFVSAGLGGEIVEKTLCEDVLQQGASRHVAGFYADEASRLDDYVRFAQCSLAAGSVFILLANGSRRDRLHERLLARGVAVDRFASEGRYLFVDFAGEFSQSIADGQLDEARFAEAAAALFNDARKTNGGDRRRIALCGEGAPRLWQGGHSHAAIRIERLWNELSKASAVDSLCAYDADMLRRDDDSRDTLQRICSEHSAVHFRRDVVA